jgi:predicted negative regulator of RcsB-dependent stress response
MTGISLTAVHPTNFTAVAISLGIVFIVGAVIAVVLWSYFQLQSHRADAVAMAAYRKLAEDAVANQQELRAQLTLLTDKVQAVEQLMREVG